jgi:hypothetical protein
VAPQPSKAPSLFVD